MNRGYGMLDRQAFNNYLISRRRNEKSISDSLKEFDKFMQFAEQARLKSPAELTAEHISDYIRPDKPSNRRVEIKNANNFMIDLAASAEKGFCSADEAGYQQMAAIIQAYYINLYEESAKDQVHRRLRHFFPLPDDFLVNPALLHGLTNAQFVAAFKALHQLVKDIYGDILNAPFEWGYPDFLTTDGYYNRVGDILFAFADCGTHSNGCITVNAQEFFKHNSVKLHKKVELMVKGLVRMGFTISGFAKKTKEFTVAFPENPHIVTALYAYVVDRVKTGPWQLGNQTYAFSYRFIEDPAAQEYEAAFHALMDSQPDELAEIQKWLHCKAAECGFFIDPQEPTEKGMMLYKKGSKRFLHVGSAGGVVRSKAILRTVFETHKEQAEQLAHNFPDTFKADREGICRFCDAGSKKPCPMRISYELFGKKLHNCAYGSFWFWGINLDNIGGLLELFKIENKIL